MNSLSYEYKNMSARRGARFVSIGMHAQTVCSKTYAAKTTKILSTMMLSSEYEKETLVILQVYVVNLYTTLMIMVLLHSFVLKWIVLAFEIKGVEDCGLVYGYFKFAVFKLIEIVILWVYYTIPFGVNFFRHFWDIIF